MVDDCSTDDTAARAEAAGATVVVHNPVNLGYEGALNIGFEFVAERGWDAVLTMDADGEQVPEHVETFRRLLVATVCFW